MVTVQPQEPLELFGGGTVPEGGRRKLEALDGIRGLAVLAVMMSHFERFLPAAGALVPVKAVFAYGWSGVDLFFVLSGFLITGILLSTRSSRNYFRSFYARRVLRIFPIYYATLVVVFVAAARLPQIAQIPPAGDRWLYFVYLTNWIAVWRNAWPPNVVGHFWSLAIEEQFYLVWPLCVLVLGRRALFRTAAGLCLAALVVRVVWVAIAGPNEGVLLSTVTRMDSLLFGAIAAMVFEKTISLRVPRQLGRWSVAALACFVAGVILTPVPLAFVETIGLSFLGLGFAFFVLRAAQGDHAGDRRHGGPVQRVFRTRALTRVGKYSYGMYVYHVPLLGVCELLIFDRLPPPVAANPFVAVLYVVFLTVATYGVAALSYELVEKRILALKRYLEPDGARDLVRAPASRKPPTPFRTS